MSNTSFTSTDSFRQRAQKSEQRRISLWIAVLAVLLLLSILRRFSGDVVTSHGVVFVGTLAIYATALVYQLAILRLIRRKAARQELAPDWIWPLGFAIDLLTPAAAMLLLEWFSPRGAIAALSGPIILLMPCVILLSVLRLRPRLTLVAGIAACLLHWGLTARAIFEVHPPTDQYAVLFTYGIGMLVLGAAGATVAREMRTHVLGITEEAAARQAAQLERDRLSHDLELARDIQRSLLPQRVPALPGFTVAGWSRPAEQTGGDYYDWIVLPDGRAIFVVADATGHGIGPALIIAVCRAYLRASSAFNPPLESLLAQVNELLVADLPAGKFVTAAVFILDPATQTGQLYSAGHAPLLFYSAAQNSVTSWDADELPLGVSADFGSVQSRRIQFQPGDMLLLLTDGFFEWPNADGELFGSDRLESSVRDHAHQPPAELIDSLLGKTLQFAGDSPQRDDLTAVVLKCTPTANAGAGI